MRVEPVSDPLNMWNRLRQEVWDYYRELFGDPKEAGEQDMGRFVMPNGRMWVAIDDMGTVAGIGCWIWMHSQGYHPTEVPEGFPYRTVELKRLFVRKQFRGKGVGRLIEAARHQDAFDQGAELLVMETSGKQVESVNLRKSYGYVPVEPFGHYAHLSDNTYWGRWRP